MDTQRNKIQPVAMGDWWDDFCDFWTSIEEYKNAWGPLIGGLCAFIPGAGPALSMGLMAALAAWKVYEGVKEQDPQAAAAAAEEFGTAVSGYGSLGKWATGDLERGYNSLNNGCRGVVKFNKDIIMRPGPRRLPLSFQAKGKFSQSEYDAKVEEFANGESCWPGTLPTLRKKMKQLLEAAREADIKGKYDQYAYRLKENFNLELEHWTPRVGIFAPGYPAYDAFAALQKVPGDRLSDGSVVKKYMFNDFSYYSTIPSLPAYQKWDEQQREHYAVPAVKKYVKEEKKRDKSGDYLFEDAQTSNNNIAEANEQFCRKQYMLKELGWLGVPRYEALTLAEVMDSYVSWATHDQVNATLISRRFKGAVDPDSMPGITEARKALEVDRLNAFNKVLGRRLLAIPRGQVKPGSQAGQRKAKPVEMKSKAGPGRIYWPGSGVHGDLGLDVLTEPKPGSFYQVREGDTLSGTKSGIALRAYDNYTAWRPIYNCKWNQENYFKKYGKTQDQLAKVGSPPSFPVLYIPVGTEEPSSGPGEVVAPPVQPPVPPAEQGPKGEKGDIGPMGPPGPGPTDAQVQKAVDTYFASHPVTQTMGPKGEKGDPGAKPSAAEIKSAVTEYMKANPQVGPKGERGEAGPGPTDAQVQKAIDSYFAAHPVTVTKGPKGDAGPGPTDAQVDAAVSKYFTAHPVTQTMGPKGEKGDPGIPGKPGSGPTMANLKEAVRQYVAENPLSSGPGGIGPKGERGEPGLPGPGPTDAQIDAAVARYVSSNPLQQATVVSSGGVLETVGPIIAAGLVMARSNLH